MSRPVLNAYDNADDRPFAKRRQLTQVGLTYRCSRVHCTALRVSAALEVRLSFRLMWER